MEKQKKKGKGERRKNVSNKLVSFDYSGNMQRAESN